jgi:hypothetical protein
MLKKIKRKYFCFYKKKRNRYEDELGSKKIAIVPLQRRKKACWYFLAKTERIRKRTELLL